MKKLVIILSSLLLLVSVAAASLNCGDSTPEPGAKVTWRLATYSMTGTLQTTLLQEFADKVNAESEGQMTIKVFPNGSLYQLTEIFDAVSSRAVDLGYAGVTSYIGKTPRTSSILVYTNVVAKSLADLNNLNNGMANESPILIADANNNGINHLFYGPLGSNDCFFKFPVNSVNDLKGKKFGCSAGVAPVVQMMGATPVPMDLADAYLSLQTGVIDGWVLSPLENYESLKMYEVAPYLVSLSFTSSMSVLMCQASFDELPANLQAVVKSAAAATQTDWNTKVAASDAAVISRLKTNSKVTVTVLSATDRTLWMDSFLKPVFMGMIKKFLTVDEQTSTLSMIAAIQAKS